jgi:hypothetical protein
MYINVTFFGQNYFHNVDRSVAEPTKLMKKKNWNVSEMNVMITIHTKTMIQTTVSNVAIVIQLISLGIGLLTALA